DGIGGGGVGHREGDVREGRGGIRSAPRAARRRVSRRRPSGTASAPRRRGRAGHAGPPQAGQRRPHLGAGPAARRPARSVPDGAAPGGGGVGTLAAGGLPALRRLPRPGGGAARRRGGGSRPAPDRGGSGPRLIGAPTQARWPVRAKNSARVRGSSRISPSRVDVTVDDPVARTPRSDMHMCSASSTTPTPLGERLSS